MDEPARRLACVIAITTGLGALLGAQPGTRQIGGVGITVYENTNYRGRSATIRDDEPDLRRLGLNDRIQSLQVASGEMWEGCEHDNFGGRCQVFSGVEPDLRQRGWSRNISSLRRVRGGGGPRPPIYPPTYPEQGRGGLTLYKNRNFGGSSRTLSGPTPDLRVLGFSDQAESLRVPRGDVWQVCKDINYRGDCAEVSSDVSDLRRLRNLSGEISSARPWRSGGGGFPGPGPGPQPPYPGPGYGGRLILYSGLNFTGRATVVTSASSSINLRSANSVRVEGGNWQICEDSNFRGRCSTVNIDVPNIRTFGLPGRVRSARPISPPRY